ncbi:hypothetical protein RJ640_017288 [Escallonia rubra]|uniref:Uncharacterized protein n=1 Tax=Escallonia rubra TaxID=112253 RepID=A0AA88URC1_9ASTE|nr:hypothetical protein RJ640_017288 [Escallonia rubra]
MRPKIYLFGDSITEESFGDGGWGASLAHHFSRTVDVVLRGYSGYNTRWALKVLDRVFPPEKEAASCGGGAPLAVTVFFGANDACLPDRCAAFQHVPVDEYKRNLLSILSFFKKRWPTTHILLITPPPIDEAARLLQKVCVQYIKVSNFLCLNKCRYPFAENTLGLPERTNDAAGAYAKACVDVAGECGTPVVGLWARMQQFPDWQKAYLRDGLHLTRGGNMIVFEEVVKQLRGSGLSLETLLVDLPLITAIDPNDPLKSFKE